MAGILPNEGKERKEELLLQVTKILSKSQEASVGLKWSGIHAEQGPRPGSSEADMGLYRKQNQGDQSLWV